MRSGGEQTRTLPIRFSNGQLDPTTLRKIATVMKKYHLPLAKITGARGITLAGVKDEQYETLCQELDFIPGQHVKVNYTIQSCCGNLDCIKGLADTQGLAAALERHLGSLQLPAKVKIAVSGCHHCCIQSMVRDLGFIARENGWTVTAGGMTGGIKPRKADVMAEGLEPQQAIALAKGILQIYAEQGQRRERIGKTMERLGVDNFKELVNNWSVINTGRNGYDN